jgi:hypothetical protein
MIAAFTAVTAMAIGPVAAQAALPITGLTAKPANTQAGGHSDFTLSFSFGGAEHVKNLTIHLPPGLVGNPTKVPACTAAQFEVPSTQANSCPAASAVGSTSVTATATIGILPTDITAAGTVYVVPPHAGEIARLGIDVTPTGAAALVGEHIRLQSGITVRKATDAGLDSALTVPQTSPSGLGDLPTRINSMSLTLNGSANGHPFMSNPTSCKAATTTIDATSNDSAGVNHASASFTPTGCDREPYTPHVSLRFSGDLSNGGRPAATVSVTQPEGQAASKRVQVVLPSIIDNGIGTSTATLCDGPHLATNSCPASSIIGTATATTPLLPVPLTGNVYIGYDEKINALPILRITLAPLGVTVTGLTGFVGTGISNTFDNLPDTPLTNFQLSLKGGRAGILASIHELCGSTGTANGMFLAHSGKTATATAAYTTSPCTPTPVAKPPKATATFRSLGKKRTGLTVTVKAATGAKKLTKATVTLPAGVRVKSVAKKLAKGAPKGSKLKRHSRSIEIRAPKGGAKTLKLTLKSGALTSTKKKPKAKLKIAVTDAAGKTTKLSVTAKKKR